MSLRFRLRRGPEATIPKLKLAEMAFTTDSHKLFIGLGEDQDPVNMTGLLLDAHVLDSAAHAASSITTVSFGGITAANVQAFLQSIVSQLTAHTNNTTNPHHVTVEQIGAETPVGAQQKVDSHTQAASNAHAATAIGFTPTTDIVATDVQTAIVEVRGDAMTAVSGLQTQVSLDIQQVETDIQTAQTNASADALSKAKLWAIILG